MRVSLCLRQLPRVREKNITSGFLTAASPNHSPSTLFSPQSSRTQLKGSILSKDQRRSHLSIPVPYNTSFTAMALMPMAMYGLEVPAGDVAISARPDIPSAFRITMAAIDPSAEPEGDEAVVPRATLKVMRQSLLDDSDSDDEDSDSDFDQEQMERLLADEYSDDSDEDDEDVNGGPSDPAKTKKARIEKAKQSVKKMLEQDGLLMDVDADSEGDDDVPNGVNGIAKSAKALGKLPVSDEDEDEDSDEDMDDDVEVEEYVICTLDPNKVRPLTITDFYTLLTLHSSTSNHSTSPSARMRRSGSRSPAPTASSSLATTSSQPPTHSACSIPTAMMKRTTTLSLIWTRSMRSSLRTRKMNLFLMALTTLRIRA